GRTDRPRTGTRSHGHGARRHRARSRGEHPLGSHHREVPMKHDSKPPVPEPETGPLEPAPEPLDVPRGVRAMALVRWLLVLVMALVAVGSVAYSFGLVSTESASAADTLYHCPMHPQVVQDHPGDCPICGMTLVKFEAQDAIA